MIAYTIVFYIYSFKKSMVLKLLLLTFLCMTFMIVYVTTEDDYNLLRARLGKNFNMLPACLNIQSNSYISKMFMFAQT